MAVECEPLVPWYLGRYLADGIAAVAGAAYLARRRTLIRQRFGIAGSRFRDFCMFFWCHCCALCQVRATSNPCCCVILSYLSIPTFWLGRPCVNLLYSVELLMCCSDRKSLVPIMCNEVPCTAITCGGHGVHKALQCWCLQLVLLREIQGPGFVQSGTTNSP